MPTQKKGGSKGMVIPKNTTDVLKLIKVKEIVMEMVGGMVLK